MAFACALALLLVEPAKGQEAAMSISPGQRNPPGHGTAGGSSNL